MKPLQADQLKGFIDNRFPGRDQINDTLFAASFCVDDPVLAANLQDLGDTLLVIRQAIRGGVINTPVGWQWPDK
jgi:hypothetical protein